jgi:Zn-dependent protease
MTPSISFGKIAGVKVGINYSLLIIAALVTWQLTLELPVRAPGFDDSVYFWYAAIGAGLFFFSILWHELAHAIVAKAYGLKVKQIVLFFLGGVAEIETEPRRAHQEFWIALIGPLSSVALGGIFLGMRELFDDASVVSAMLWWLGTINLLLAAFNMLPGFPLDGGRVLRAVIWWLSGNYLSASRLSAYLGQGMGGLMIVGGIFSVFFGNITGLWLLFLGMFFLNAARAQLWFAERRAGLTGVSMGQLVGNHGGNIAVNADWPLSYAVDMMSIGAGGRSAAPVVQNGEMIGVFPLEHVRNMSPMNRVNKIVRDVMVPMNGVRAVDAQVDLFDALNDNATNDYLYLLVVQNQRPIGLLSQRDLLNYQDRMLQQA